jgi:1,4-alpha-glucan branching enzyme
LNTVYRKHPALFERDFNMDGFRWVDCNDWEESIISFLRRGSQPDDTLLVVCNFTPVPRKDYKVGVPDGGFWREVLNSDAWIYGGSNVGNFGGRYALPISVHGFYQSLSLNLPPLGIVVFRRENSPE